METASRGKPVGHLRKLPPARTVLQNVSPTRHIQAVKGTDASNTKNGIVTLRESEHDQVAGPSTPARTAGALRDPAISGDGALPAVRPRPTHSTANIGSMSPTTTTSLQTSPGTKNHKLGVRRGHAFRSMPAFVQDSRSPVDDSKLLQVCSVHGGSGGGSSLSTPLSPRGAQGTQSIRTAPGQVVNAVAPRSGSPSPVKVTETDTAKPPRRQGQGPVLPHVDAPSTPPTTTSSPITRTSGTHASREATAGTVSYASNDSSTDKSLSAPGSSGSAAGVIPQPPTAASPSRVHTQSPRLVHTRHPSAIARQRLVDRQQTPSSNISLHTPLTGSSQQPARSVSALAGSMAQLTSYAPSHVLKYLASLPAIARDDEDSAEEGDTPGKGGDQGKKRRRARTVRVKPGSTARPSLTSPSPSLLLSHGGSGAGAGAGGVSRGRSCDSSRSSGVGSDCNSVTYSSHSSSSGGGDGLASPLSSDNGDGRATRQSRRGTRAQQAPSRQQRTGAKRGDGPKRRRKPRRVKTAGPRLTRERAANSMNVSSPGHIPSSNTMGISLQPVLEGSSAVPAEETAHGYLSSRAPSRTSRTSRGSSPHIGRTSVRSATPRTRSVSPVTSLFYTRVAQAPPLNEEESRSQTPAERERRNRGYEPEVAALLDVSVTTIGAVQDNLPLFTLPRVQTESGERETEKQMLWRLGLAVHEGSSDHQGESSTQTSTASQPADANGSVNSTNSSSHPRAATSSSSSSNKRHGSKKKNNHSWYGRVQEELQQRHQADSKVIDSVMSHWIEIDGCPDLKGW
eukprot:TRINITY_DN1196_c0_g1_i1.p1 TRINITY_DN1196_c0_g1~~TRINITY_DN1196_c0_g1_i1.p1  ORF type:complete len:793 (-),score=81.13 TRINITY_DN1196_c0_g1_i1:29-2407(-)